MDLFIELFGKGKGLTILQMVCRGIVVFFIALILIRISGRRSFGIRTALDNIIAVLLGAVLSRAVVGASPFLPTIICCLVIVLLHRAFGWLIVHSKKFARLMEGHKIALFKNGAFIESNLKRGLVNHEDVMQGVRKSALTEDMDDIESVYLERNGEVSPVRKKSNNTDTLY